MTGFYEISMGRTALTLSIVLALTLSGGSQGREPGSPEDTALPLARTEPKSASCRSSMRCASPEKHT